MYQVDVPAWIQRLRDQATSFRQFGGAADLATAQDATVTMPSGYVYPVAETAEGSDTGTEVISQRVTARVAVAIAAKNLRDARGDAALADLAALRQEILSALLGWTPNGEFTPVQFARGQLVKFSNAVLWWQDEFTTQFYRRVT